MRPMIPSRDPLSRKCIFAHGVAPNPQFLLLASAMILLSGCAYQRQSWRDWMESPLPAPAMAAQSPAWMFPTNSIGSLAPSYRIGDGARVAPGFDLKMRNPDFPNTFIEAVYINLSDPTNGLTLKWTGSLAEQGPVGPWPITPGRGSNGRDCDSVEDSNMVNSLCTPKGNFPVAGFADHLEQTPICRYATWVVYAPRYIAIHSHTELPPVPASAGCVRVPHEAAKLIHNNSRVGITLVSIGGTWHRPSLQPIVLSNTLAAPLTAQHNTP